MRKTTALRKLIESGKTYLIPGVYDGLSARIAQAAGAELLYATGGGIARSTGIPAGRSQKRVASRTFDGAC